MNLQAWIKQKVKARLRESCLLAPSCRRGRVSHVCESVNEHSCTMVMNMMSTRTWASFFPVVTSLLSRNVIFQEGQSHISKGKKSAAAPRRRCRCRPRPVPSALVAKIDRSTSRRPCARIHYSIKGTSSLLSSLSLPSHVAGPGPPFKVHHVLRFAISGFFFFVD